MSILKGPGILLNSVTVQQPAHIPKLFGLVLEAKGANLCAVRDEIGAIAYALHEEGAVDEGNQLFDILESGYKLVDKRDDILSCIKCATPQILSSALTRSARYLRDYEIPPIRRGRKQISDIYILQGLIEFETQRATSEALGISQDTINKRIVRAAEDSVLGVFKGVFKRGGPAGSNRGPNQIVSDTDIYSAVIEHGTLTAAARALKVTAACLSKRIIKAEEDSDLHSLKGTFKPGRPKEYR